MRARLIAVPVNLLAGGCADAAVADAAAAFLATQGSDPDRWYAALGGLEAACRGQR